MNFLFFSTESEAPAGYFLINILNPLQKEFNKNHFASDYTNLLDNISIIPICISENLKQNGGYRERRYITLKKRYADVRLYLNYLEFLSSNEEKKKEICMQIIVESINIISKKVLDLNKEKLLNDIKTILFKI